MTKTSGTKEWADKNCNFQQGCKNGCLYCYALRMAKRRKVFTTMKEWISKAFISWKKVFHKYQKLKKKNGRDQRIMIPSTHDIYQENEHATMRVLNRHLKVGNKLLITTKPELYMIKRICNELKQYKDQIQFRFTITSCFSDTLAKVEIKAPSFEERLESLKYAFNHGFKTSISIEPYLDNFVYSLIGSIEPYVSESIWVGVMNSRMIPTKEGREYYNEQKEIYQLPFISKMLPSWKQIAKGKLRLKDSIKNMIKDKLLSQTTLNNLDSTGVIKFYRANGKYGFLSNLFPMNIKFEGKYFPSSEYAYQYGKFADKEIADWVMTSPKAHLVAIIGHGLFAWDIVKDWSKIKLDRMEKIVRAKFNQHVLARDCLLNTENKILIENSSFDNFWGSGPKGKGKNHLGKILMKIRKELQKENGDDQNGI